MSSRKFRSIEKIGSQVVSIHRTIGYIYQIDRIEKTELLLLLIDRGRAGGLWELIRALARLTVFSRLPCKVGGRLLIVAKLTIFLPGVYYVSAVCETDCLVHGGG